MKTSSDASLRCSLVPLQHSHSSLCGTLKLNLEKHFPRLLFPEECAKGTIFLNILHFININYHILDLLMVRILASRHLIFPLMSKLCGFYLMVPVSLTMTDIHMNHVYNFTFSYIPFSYFFMVFYLLLPLTLKYYFYKKKSSNK